MTEYKYCISHNTASSVDSNNNDEEQMKLATQMMSSLGDKYSRMLDRPSYSRIQKYDLIGVGTTLMPPQSQMPSGVTLYTLPSSTRRVPPKGQTREMRLMKKNGYTNIYLCLP